MLMTKRRRLQGPSESQGNPALLRLYIASLDNAERLCSDAEMLFEARRFPSAYALAYTALEEISKGHAVADFYTGVLSRSEFDDAFRDHRMKAAYLDRTVLISSNPSTDATVQYDRRLADSTVQSRMSALYVDHCDDLTPITPVSVIGADAAATVIEQVRTLLHEILVNDEYDGHQIGTKGLWK